MTSKYNESLSWDAEISNDCEAKGYKHLCTELKRQHKDNIELNTHTYAYVAELFDFQKGFGQIHVKFIIFIWTYNAGSYNNN